MKPHLPLFLLILLCSVSTKAQVCQMQRNIFRTPILETGPAKLMATLPSIKNPERYEIKKPERNTMRQPEKTHSSRSALMTPDSMYYWHYDTAQHRWWLQYKVIYDFDANGNLIFEQIQTFDNIFWHNRYQYFLTYDENNNMLSLISQTWMDTSASWRNGVKITYQWNENNDMIDELHQNWGGNLQWNMDYRYHYTYDLDNNMVQINGYGNAAGVWHLYYNSNNDCDSLIGTRMRYYNTFDSNHNITYQLIQWYENSNWTDYQLDVTASYNSNHDMLTYLDRSWETSSHSWTNGSQFLRTYDLNFNLTEEIYNQLYWDDHDRSTYQYDVYNKQVHGLGEYWNGGNWVPSGQDTLVYDAWDNGIAILAQYWPQNGWVNSDSLHYYYPPATTDVVENTDASVFSVYPNPAHNILNVECRMQNSELRLYDVTGRIALVKQLNSQFSTINFQLSAGIYFVKVNDGEKVYMQKLVIE